MIDVAKVGDAIRDGWYFVETKRVKIEPDASP